ncbi:MAG: hypothetical protein L7F77_11200 [Candidatus Magnetominusculus sp. LBB02]|nr:hypothetical protein [Candidatus Magnetominusculus sp. LBB02]
MRYLLSALTAAVLIFIGFFIGTTCAEDQTVMQSYGNGSPHISQFNEDKAVPEGFVVKKGTEYVQFENGKTKRATLAEDWQIPNGPILKGGEEVEFYENGKTKIAVLAKDFELPNSFVIKAGTVHEVYPNRLLKTAVPARTFYGKDGFTAKADTEFEQSESGKILRATLAEDWITNNTLYKADTVYKGE